MPLTDPASDLLARAGERLVDLFPIDQAIPERLKILRARVAIVDVIGVLPHVAAEDRRRAHGVDVAQRIGHGDGSPGRRVVYDWGEEINGGDQCAVRGKQKDRGVVFGGGVDQDPGVGDVGQKAQDLLARGFRPSSITASIGIKRCTA